MAHVSIPSLLRPLCGGKREMELPGTTVREVLEALDAACPGMGIRLLDGDSLRPALGISIDGEMAGADLNKQVAPHSEIAIIPAIAGGEL